MIRIYQIGRLEKNITTKIKFKFENFECESELSSFVLKEKLERESKNPILTIFFPVSLPFNPNLKNNNFIDEFKNKLNEITKDDKSINEYLSNPDIFWELHPHIKDRKNDFLVIPSIGKYEINGQEIEFKNSFEILVLSMFLKFVNDFMNTENRDNEDYEIFIDVSSGQNIYISAMLEAVRNFYVFYSLYYIGKNKKPVLKILYSDPIIETKNKINIGTYKVEYKVFFSLPFEKTIKFSKEFNTLLKKERRKEIESVLNNNLTTLFSAIKNGTYLILPYLIEKYNIKNEIMINYINEITSEYIKEIKNHLKANEQIQSTDKTIRLLLSIAMYYGLLNSLSSFKLFENSEIDLEKIREYSENLSNSLNISINSMFIEEIHNIKKKIKGEKIKIKENNEYFLYEIYGDSEQEIRKSHQIIMRNVLAHGGLEKTITKIIKKDGKIYLKYDETVKNGNENRSKLEFIISKLTEYI